MKEKLTRVTSESQLFPGVLVELRQCLMCGKARERAILTRRVNRPKECDVCGQCDRGWHVAGGCCPRRTVCYTAAIDEGRLYLVDPFTEQEQRTTTSNPMERVRP